MNRSAGMTRRARERNWLTALWVSFFVASLVALTWLLFSNQIHSDNFLEASLELNSLYAPYIGVALTFYFTRAAASRARSTDGRTRFLLAVMSTLVWNGLIAVQVLRLLVGYTDIESFTPFLRGTGAVASWLIGPFMAFYFVKESTTP